MDPNVLYSGIWAPDNTPNRIQVGAMLDPFKATWQSNRDEGFHLQTLDVSGIGADREWVGVFMKNGDEETIFEGDLSLGDMKAKHADLQMRTFVAYSDGATELFAGAWAKGDADWKFDGSMRLDQFGERIKQLRTENFHLVDFQTTQVSGERKWAGLWRKKDAGFTSEIWIDFDQDHFRAKKKENTEKGLQLVRMKTYRNDGRTRYSGVWHPGNDQRLVFPDMKLDSLSQQIKQMRLQGFCLIDLDARSLEDGGDAVDLHLRLAVNPPSLPNWLEKATNLYAEKVRLNIRKVAVQTISTGFSTLDLRNSSVLPALIATASGLPANAIVVFLVNAISNGRPVNGVTNPSSPRGIAISGQDATPWTLAHELGHLLMGHDPQAGHHPDRSNLMFRSTNDIIGVPGLITEQINTIKKSPFVIRG